MKTFFQKYGPLVVLNCIVCLLVIMASLIGQTINSNPKAPTKSTSKAKSDYTGPDISEINDGGYLNETSSVKVHDMISRLDVNKSSGVQSVVKVKYLNGKYIVDKEAPTGDIVKAESYILGMKKGTPGYNLFDSNSSYKYSQSVYDELDLAMDYNNCYLQAYSNSGKDVIFDKKGYIELQGKESDYSIAMTYDDDAENPTKWDTIEFIGNNSKRVSVRKETDGYILSADDLKNTKIVINIYLNDTIKERKFSTNYKKVLVYEKPKKEIGIKIDSNSDGKFDKELS